MTAAAQTHVVPLAQPRTKVPQSPAKRRDWLTALLFLAPFLVVYLVLLVYPLFLGIWISFRDWDLMGGDYGWIGTLNYQDLWADPVFWRAAGNTLKFAAMTVPSMTLVALLLALAVFYVVVVVLATVKAANGQEYRYPLTLRLVS